MWHWLGSCQCFRPVYLGSPESTAGEAELDPEERCQMLQPLTPPPQEPLKMQSPAPGLLLRSTYGQQRSSEQHIVWWRSRATISRLEDGLARAAAEQRAEQAADDTSIEQLRTQLAAAEKRAAAAEQRADDAVDDTTIKQLRTQLAAAEERAAAAERRADDAVDALLEDCGPPSDLERRMQEAEARAAAAEKRADAAVDALLGESADALEERLEEAESRAIELNEEAGDQTVPRAVRSRSGSPRSRSGSVTRLTFSPNIHVLEIPDKETMKQEMWNFDLGERGTHGSMLHHREANNTNVGSEWDEDDLEDDDDLL